MTTAKKILDTTNDKERFPLADYDDSDDETEETDEERTAAIEAIIADPEDRAVHAGDIISDYPWHRQPTDTDIWNYLADLERFASIQESLRHKLEDPIFLITP